MKLTFYNTTIGMNVYEDGWIVGYAKNFDKEFSANSRHKLTYSFGTIYKGYCFLPTASAAIPVLLTGTLL